MRMRFRFWFAGENCTWWYGEDCARTAHHRVAWRGIVSNMAQENGSSQAIAVKSTPWKVRSLAQLKAEKRLHLPDLQRGFVWSPERVRTLFDSLYRRYPIGALLLWKPTWDGPEAPFETRPWDLAPPSSLDGRGVKENSHRDRAGFYFPLRWPAAVDLII